MIKKIELHNMVVSILCIFKFIILLKNILPLCELQKQIYLPYLYSQSEQ